MLVSFLGYFDAVDVVVLVLVELAFGAPVVNVCLICVLPYRKVNVCYICFTTLQ